MFHVPLLSQFLHMHDAGQSNSLLLYLFPTPVSIVSCTPKVPHLSRQGLLLPYVWSEEFVVVEGTMSEALAAMLRLVREGIGLQLSLPSKHATGLP